MTEQCESISAWTRCELEKGHTGWHEVSYPDQDKLLSWPPVTGLDDSVLADEADSREPPTGVDKASDSSALSVGVSHEGQQK